MRDSLQLRTIVAVKVGSGNPTELSVINTSRSFQKAASVLKERIWMVYLRLPSVCPCTTEILSLCVKEKKMGQTVAPVTIACPKVATHTHGLSPLLAILDG